MTQQELLKLLRSNTLYRQALGSARNDAERAQLAAAAESYVTSVGEVLLPLIVRAKSDPDFAKQLSEALKGSSSVLKGSEPETGSDA